MNDSISDDAAMAQLRAERDAALEEVAYLREQVRSLIAYHAHQLEEERRWMFDERARLAGELETLREEMHRRTFPGARAARSTSGSRATPALRDTTVTR